MEAASGGSDFERRDFENRAQAVLEGLMTALEEGLGDRLEDIELSGGILTFEIEGGAKYVLNKNAVKRELWLASPRSGAWHFAFNAEKSVWLDTRQGKSLIDLLAAELGLPGQTLDPGS
jgi:frataxin